MKDHETSPEITKDHEISQIISDKMSPKNHENEITKDHQECFI